MWETAVCLLQLHSIRWKKYEFIKSGLEWKQLSWQQKAWNVFTTRRCSSLFPCHVGFLFFICWCYKRLKSFNLNNFVWRHKRGLEMCSSAQEVPVCICVCEHRVLTAFNSDGWVFQVVIALTCCPSLPRSLCDKHGCPPQAPSCETWWT